MSATYPGGIKNFGIDLVDGRDSALAQYLNDLRFEVAAIEEELGITPSGDPTGVIDLVGRLNTLDSLVADKLSSGKFRRKTIWLVYPDDTNPPDAGSYQDTGTKLTVPSMLFDSVTEKKVHFTVDIDYEMDVASAIILQISFYLTTAGAGAETVKFRIWQNSPDIDGNLNTAATEFSATVNVASKTTNKRYVASITIPGATFSPTDLFCCTVTRDTSVDTYPHDVGVTNISMLYTTAREI